MHDVKRSLLLLYPNYRERFLVFAFLGLLTFQFYLLESYLAELNLADDTGIAQVCRHQCSWRACFQENHTCSRCRDSDQEFGAAPYVPPGWIPDATILKKIRRRGKDANGRRWPPTLDNELCEDIGSLDPFSTNDIEKRRK